MGGTGKNQVTDFSSSVRRSETLPHESSTGGGMEGMTKEATGGIDD